MSEYVVVKRELLALLRQYVAEADPYGDAPMLLQDIDTALAAGEARPVAQYVYFRRQGGNDDRLLIPWGESPGMHVKPSLITRIVPLYAAPQGDAQ